MPITLREFETTQPDIDFTNLSSTITVSGVRLFKDVTINGLITDNISGDVSNGASFLENPYTSKVNVDILNQDGSVAYQNFLQDYKSTNFTFTEYDNVNVFGEYEKDFGVRIKVVGRDDLEQTTELFLYGNHPLISGIKIHDASGIDSFNASKASPVQVSASGQTGNLSGLITFYNDPEYISFNRIEVYSSPSSDEFINQVDPNIVLSRPIVESDFQYSFNIQEGLISDSSEFYLHFVTYGQFGTGDIWTVGPHKFENEPAGSNEIGLQSLQQVTDIGNFTSNEVVLRNKLNMSSEDAEIDFLGGAARMTASSAESTSVAGFKIRSDKYQFNVGSEENSNEVNSFASVALAGTKNKIFGDFDGIVVGTKNIISGLEIDGAATGNADYNFIGAGSGISIFQSSFSSIVGGADNEISQDSKQSFIGGGSGNTLAGSRNSVIAGGINNSVQSSESVQVFGSYVIDGGGPHNGYVYLADNENRVKSPSRSDALFIDFINGVDIKTGALAVGEGITMSGGQAVASQNWVESKNYLTSATAISFTGINSSHVTDALGYTPVDPSTTGALVNDNDIANFITGISSSDVTDALGYTPLSAETDDQTLDEVLSQGNTSASGITVGASTISGSLEVSNNNTGISDIFYVDGLNGRLFGVTDEVTGTVFSVNDAAGLPIVEVESTSTYDKITMGEYGSDLIVLSGQTSAQLTGSQIASESWVASQGYLTSETDDQTLDEVLAQGNTSSYGIHVNQITGTALTIDTDTLFVDSTNDRVGIGTTSPDSKLQVKSSGSNIDEITLVHSGNTVKIAALGQESSHGSLYLRHNNGVNKVRLSAGGNSSYILDSNVGIGTNSPQNKLHVVGTKIRLDTNSGGFYQYTAGGAFRSALYDDSSKTYLFADGDGATPHMTFDGGNVGIGTTNPNAKLKVNGPIVSQGGSYASEIDSYTDVGLVMTKGDYLYSDNGQYLRKLIGHTSANALEIGQGATALISDINLRPGSSGNISFFASGSEDVRINASGNVGIGTTSPTEKLHVEGNIELINGGHIGSLDGSYWQRLRFEDATPSTTNAFNFETRNGSGSFIKHMVIRNDGNVGIGVTNPSYALQVGGSIVGTSKNFIIDHPTKEGKKLLHGCIEGPEAAVYFRGKSTSNIIEMPDYWIGLVDIDTMTVDITPWGPNQDLYVEDISDDGEVTVGSNTEEPLNYFYVVYGERKDIDKLEIEVIDAKYSGESTD